MATLAAAVLGFFVITLDAVVVNVALRRVAEAARVFHQVREASLFDEPPADKPGWRR